MTKELENIINELNPSVHLGEYRNKIINLFEQEYCSIETLKAAVRWMEYYGKPINDDREYKLMIYDDNVGESYKIDINSIRKALGKSVISI